MALVAPASGQHVLWGAQFGTTSVDVTAAAVGDSEGGWLVAGTTSGSLFGPNSGDRDVFLAHFTGTGVRDWAKQFGTPESDISIALAPDGAGGAFFAGATTGSLFSPAGGPAFLAHIDDGGNVIWGRQFGAGPTSGTDAATATAADDAGGAYVAGRTGGDLFGTSAGFLDAFVARYDKKGNLLWGRQFGTSGADGVFAALPDGAGGVYVTGNTAGSLFGPVTGQINAFVARYDASGALMWGRQFGGGDDYGYALAPDDAGGVFVSGAVDGSVFGPYGQDAFLARYDGDGGLIWGRQFGSAARDEAHAVAPDGLGGAIVGGWTFGSYMAPHFGGTTDGILARYSGAGMLIWAEQFGTDQDDSIEWLAEGGPTEALVVGTTRGKLFAPRAGAHDAYAALYFTPCYADCNADRAFNLADFGCYQTKFALGDSYADCNRDGLRNLSDFGCFQTKFALGCP